MEATTVKIKPVLGGVSVVGIILAFTAVDYLVHTLSPDFAVPDYYFSHKVIFGCLIGGLIYFLSGSLKPMPRALAFSGGVATLLQLNYLYVGYPLWFVGFFLVVHFLILLPVSYMVFKSQRLIETYL